MMKHDIEASQKLTYQSPLKLQRKFSLDSPFNSNSKLDFNDRLLKSPSP